MSPEIYDSKLKEAVTMVCTMLGVKTPPDPVTMGHIKRIFNNYHNITYREFVNAFELNILGEYGEVYEHFQNFDMVFVSRILGMYRVRKQNAIKEAEYYKPKELPAHESTNEDYYNRLVEYIKTNNTIPFTWNYSAVYEYMRESGMITESKEWRHEFKKGIEEKMKAKLTADKLKSKDAIERIRLEDAFNETNIKSACQREYVIYKLTTKKNVKL